MTLDRPMTFAEVLSTTPIIKKALADKMQIHPRLIEAAVQQARLEGHPICSDSDGYWLGTAEEVLACSQRLRRRAINQLLTSRALRRTARRMAAPQIELPRAA